MHLPIDDSESMNFSHSSVESSPLYGPLSAVARQCLQESMQERVTSHATSRKAGTFLFSSALITDYMPPLKWLPLPLRDR